MLASQEITVSDCVKGERGEDGLTLCERQIIETLRLLGYEVAPTGKWQRTVRRAA